MTECERIVLEGIIEKKFLEEEVRCDYLVSSKIKKVWAIYIDMLLVILNITKKYNLRCWMAYGALLGTIRHKGFIPWDDDLDVWMPRPDYERFVEVCAKELTRPYFLQTTLNDEDYYNSFARLRNSNTTGILVSHHNKCNNRIFLDIFPLDGAYESSFKQKIHYNWIKINNSIAHAYTYNINPNIIARTIHAILHLPFISYDKKRVYSYTDRLSRNIKWNDSPMVGMTAFTPYRWNTNRYLKNWFADTIKMPFENISVPVPQGYDNILTTIYGDYMKFPPKEKRGNWHNFILEPDIPYRDYMEQNHLYQ